MYYLASRYRAKCYTLILTHKTIGIYFSFISKQMQPKNNMVGSQALCYGLELELSEIIMRNINMN
jgi:hypothetical protein